MAGFLYFVEGAELTAWHTSKMPPALGGVLAACIEEVMVVRGGGPGGGTGYIIRNRDTSDGTSLAYLPADQVWRKAAGEPYWVGMYTHAPPTAEDLARPKQLPGVDVELAGQSWIVPIVRYFEAGQSACFLPAAMVCDDDGHWERGDVVAKHRYLMEAVTPFWDAWHKAISEALEDGQEKCLVELANPIDMAVAVLGANYRLDRTEASLLELFSGFDAEANNSRDVLFLACDCARALQWLQDYTKKKDGEPRQESSGLNISPGDAA